MLTESVDNYSRNPPLHDAVSLAYFPKDFLKSKTSLEEDIYLNEFITYLSPFFINSQEFLRGATFAHQIINTVPAISLPEEISEDTVNDFREDIERDYQRRKNQNLDADWYVKDPKSKNPKIYRRNIDLGEKMLKTHLYFASSDYDDLTEYFRGFENPQFKTGAFTVFTLKKLEEQKILEEQEKSQALTNQELIMLIPSEPQLIKSA